MIELAVVVPVYGCPEAIEELILRVTSACAQLTDKYKLILVDDYCPSDSWSVIQNNIYKYRNVCALRLSRNFGQHYAILAGMRHVDAEYYVVMDCDLQDEPEIIPELYKLANQGHQKVLVRRNNRKHGLLERLTSWCFYGFLGYMTNTKQEAEVGNFGIYSYKVVAQLRKLSEKSRLLPVHSRWVGFSTEYLPLEHSDRHSGVSSYSFKKRMTLAIDVVMSFSDKPLWMMIKLGFSIAFMSLGYAFYVLVMWYLDNIEVEGWTSLMISIWFFGGMTLSTLGFVGVYIAKTFEETKGRPLFIVDEILESSEK